MKMMKINHPVSAKEPCACFHVIHRAENVFLPLTTPQPIQRKGYLLLSCMDFRLRDEVGLFMHQRGMQNLYDETIWPGAAMGLMHPYGKGWFDVFCQQLALANSMHPLHTVMVMEHVDCGLYKHVLGDQYGNNQNQDRIHHTHYVQILAQKMALLYPEIAVEGLWLQLDGRVQTLLPLPKERYVLAAGASQEKRADPTSQHQA